AAGRRAMLAASPSAASGLSFRRSEEIADLIDLFSKTQYRAKEVTPRVRVEAIEKRCLELFARDYKYSIIQNSSGDVCGHYPRQIVFLEYESTDGDRDRDSTVQISKLQDLVNRSKLARCRGRFVCPVILYNGKHICRSATLAGWGELYGRTGYNYIFSGGSDDTWADSEEFPEDSEVRNGDSQLFDKVRGHDIKLLRYLSVRYICDLMVENKKVKFGLNVTSSEKVDKAQRYADFTLLSVPYPGCEFFKDYKDRDYTAEGLVFNWNQDHVDAPLTIPPCFSQNLNIDWTQYQSWDLVEQTQNYLKLLLHIINSDDNSGLLVHCISGWDRTPLFVSLLRFSLWADGAVHASLEPAEILYLTIAYDWFLFGHLLPDRLSKGEEIFFFCFNFLKHIVSEKFSAVRKQRRKNSQFRDGEFTVEDLCQLSKPAARISHCMSSSLSSLSFNQSENTILLDIKCEERKMAASSPQMVVWCKQNPAEEHLSQLVNEGRSSSSSSSNQSEQGAAWAGSSPLAVPSRRCPLPTERQVRLEAVRELFLAAYSSTVGLKSSTPSPSGAISGLLEQFARGVGLRGTNAIV
uniref:Myotubularin related protein 14 n=1 Tax=Oryzias sinensis TaxID=183150 RepID=A0A8C7ZYU8_9TELE